MSWIATTIGDICKLEYGKPLEDEYRNINGLYPVFGANGEKTRSNKFLYSKPSIVVGRKGSAGELNLIGEKFWALDVTYYVTYDEKKYDVKFLYYLLLTKNLTSLAKGIKPGINRNDVYSIKVNVPSLAIQNEIVEKLDAAFAEIDKAISVAQQNAGNAKSLFQSYLTEIINDCKNQNGSVRLSELCEFENGDRGKNYPSKVHQISQGIPFINAGDLTEDGKISVKGMAYISEERFNLLGAGKVKNNDILFCLRGSLGKCGVVENINTGAIASSLVIIRVRTQVADHRFIYSFLTSSLCAEYINNTKGGAAQPNLSAKSVMNFLIPKISLDEQLKISNNLQLLSVETDNLYRSYANKINELRNLKSSILTQAFNGELTKA